MPLKFGLPKVIWFFHFGSVRSGQSFGASASLTLSVL